jgi:CBS domain-containing protein
MMGDRTEMPKGIKKHRSPTAQGETRRQSTGREKSAVPLDTLTVEDLMSVALVTAKPEDLMRRAHLTMRYADIRHLPVIDENHHIIGIVSDRDVLRALHGRRKRSAQVRDIMTQQVYRVRPETPAHEAATMMIVHKIGALPVVGTDGRLVGLITDSDFLRLFSVAANRTR